MPLTEKEMRVITSPLSFSSKQRKTTKFRTKVKIQEILSDVQFLMENYSKVQKEFGIDMLENNPILEYLESQIKENDKDISQEDKSSNDADFL